MARVAVLLMNVWQCPHCTTAVKARTANTVVTGSEYHLLRQHDIMAGPSWDPPIEYRHWAFNVFEKAEAPNMMHNELTA